MADADDAAELWDSVVDTYDAASLVSLTNIRDRSATTASSADGTSAAAEVIDLWPIYAQEEFDVDNATHMAVGRHAVIAVLWKRGGTASAVAKVEWSEVFGPDGMVGKVMRTSPRSRPAPSSNSSVETSAEAIGGRAVFGWSDPAALPRGYMPNRMPADGLS